MDSLPPHIMQSSAWGTFRKKTGVRVLSDIPHFQMSIHPLPKIPYTVGYIPKCPLPTPDVLKKLEAIGSANRCIFIKFEPNVVADSASRDHLQSKLQVANYKLRVSPHPLFIRYTFHIDLRKSEEALMKQMKSKTRYNIRVAQKHGVAIKDETDSPDAFEHYIDLSRETWKRQNFRGHTEEYHRTMWKILKPAGIAHLLIAYYKPEDKSYELRVTNYEFPLAAWILFLYKDVLYYPYGASSTKHKKTMASNLMMWEAIRWGKWHDASMFDLWGALGPEPDKNDAWYGFHRFKEGYGGKLVELVGSYDLVLNEPLYRLYNIIHPIRQRLLRL